MLALVVLLSLATTAVQARVTMTPAAWTSTPVEVIDPGKDWVDDEGVFHVRDRIVILRLEGDLVGTAEAVQNLNIDLATGDGNGWAITTVTAMWVTAPEGERRGTFEGRPSVTIRGGVMVSGTGMLHGSDGFEGLKAKISNVSQSVPGGPFTVEAIILNLP